MIIVKIGGGAGINLRGAVEDLARIDEPYLIVHGANARRDDLAKRLGVRLRTVTSLSGQASVFSDEEAVDLLMMAYAGLANKRIVELCQSRGINAIGLTGLDGRVIQGRRNAGIRVREDGRIKILRDRSGKPVRADAGLLRLLMANGYVPVLTVPLVDEWGEAINSENDDVVAILQRDLGADAVVMLIEAPGLLRDAGDEGSVAASLRPEDLASWEKAVSGRMRRKLRALRTLFENGVARVVLADGRREHPILDALESRGTVIVRGDRRGPGSGVFRTAAADSLIAAEGGNDGS